MVGSSSSLAYSHLTLQLHQVGALLGHGYIVELALLGGQQFEPAVGWILQVSQTVEREMLESIQQLKHSL